MENLHILKVLLSWTVHLSSYTHPHQLPEIEYRDHSFFVENICDGNNKCDIAAWYDDNGTIYLDRRVENNQDPMTRSLIVHELTHYLQDLSNKYDPQSCDDHVFREREAYSIQRLYLHRIAQRFIAIYQNFPPCPFN